MKEIKGSWDLTSMKCTACNSVELIETHEYEAADGSRFRMGKKSCGNRLKESMKVCRTPLSMIASLTPGANPHPGMLHYVK